MKDYYYNPVKAEKGDIIAYSEWRKGSPNDHKYADGICIMDYKDGIQVLIFHIATVNGKLTEYEDKNPSELVHCVRSFNSNDTILTDCIKIGTIKNNPEMLTLKFAKKYYKDKYSK